MLKVYTCIAMQHDLRLVALAALVCAVPPRAGSYRVVADQGYWPGPRGLAQAQRPWRPDRHG